MTNRKSTCILTLQRCGSELLQHYVEKARNLNFAGEYLTLHGKPKIVVSEHVSDTGHFLNDHHFNVYDVSNIINVFDIEYDHGLNEFEKRINHINQFSEKYGPVVVKCFIHTIKELTKFIDLLVDNFNIIVLSRKNIWLSCLSYFICKETNIWHVYESSNEVEEAKSVINSTKITADEDQFYYHVMHHNYLSIIQKNIKYFTSDALTLHFEDYEQDPINNLNKIFNYNLNEPFIQLNKLIQDHESRFDNIENLRKIYNRYVQEH